MRKEAVIIPYPGSCASVNHYLGRRKDGGYYVKAETKTFKEELMWLLKRCYIDDKWQLPIEVTCSGWFENERAAPDLSNLSKCILDTIEELTGINDKNMRWVDGKRTIAPKEKPYLLIVIKEGVASKPEPLPDSAKSKSRRVRG